ncbi:FadR/GntR family transcriptional regulator [Cryptosporangium sp. NPDC048952]|uniref:FadR/GntR family transcriptional regulator n=1 Tax=Cryptosporangium sp. NPDC048952 TaxID=3363961 RepID=UPI00372139A7
MTIAEGIERSSAVPETLAPQVARQLEIEIMQRGWPVGQLLGSETELRERFGVSRSVLREAIRLLENQRIARMRRGPGGGLVVHAPEPSTVTRALVIYLEYLGTSTEDLLGARLLLEPLAVRLATERVTEDDIAELRAAIEDEQSADHGFHVLVGQFSGNTVLRLFTEVLAGLTAQYSRVDRRTSRTAIRADSALRHRDIVDAMLAGDAASAQIRMIAHLEEIEAWLLANRPRTTSRMRTRPVDPHPDIDPNRKRAEVLAGLIHDDIADGERQVGDVFGSETDLLARYRVSRAVLREAVRILEHHSVAQMRRGHGGGLVILAPDPAASIHLMALYLNYRGLRAEHLVSVREVLELGCIRAATTVARTPEGSARLRSALARDDGEVFHTELAELAGNPVLSLFLRITTELWADQGCVDLSPGTTDTTGVGGVHEAILEAIVAGDEGLAQHRMRRHLRKVALERP